MKKYNLLILNISTILYLELIFHLFIFKSVNIIDILYLILSSIIIGLFLSIIIIPFKKINKKILKTIYLIIVSFISLLFLEQLTYYKFYSSITSIYSLTHGGQVFAFIPAIIKVIIRNIIPFTLMFIPLIITIINFKKINFNYSKKQLFLLILITILMITTYIPIIKLDKKDIYSRKNLYESIQIGSLTSKKIGLIPTMVIDLNKNIFKSNITIYPSNNNVSYDSNKYNIEDINSSNNYNVNMINDYVKGIAPTKKNQYTSLFKDKNLIVITAESFSSIAIDKDITPTLYKLQNDGFDFSNYYTPLYYTSTSDGEFMHLTSLLPNEMVWSFPYYSKNYFKYNYANVFKSLGYSANAYHNGEYNFYNRNITHSNLGYKFNACGMGLEKDINCNIWPGSDLEMIEKTVDDYIDNDKFLAYYMSISGHLNYKKSNNAMTKKNYELVSNLNYSSNILGYMASNIELDRALEYLIKTLDNKNKLDNTVIVITADHYPYGLSINELKEKQELISEKFDIHKNSLIIWSNDLKTKNINRNIDKVCSNLDLLPTLLNLFGIKYDSRVLIGKDILSDSKGLVILNDHSWITNDAKYDILTDKIYSNDNISKSYINEIKKEVNNRFTLSNLILENDYYK